MAIDERKLRKLAEEAAAGIITGTDMSDYSRGMWQVGRDILALLDAPAEQPTWEPGTVLKSTFSDLIVRVDSRLNDGSYVYTNLASGNVHAAALYPSDYAVHRRPHEFKVGDWFATKNNLVRQVSEDCGDGSIVDYCGVQRLCSEIRHIPAPREAEAQPKVTLGDMEHRERIRRYLSDIKTAVGNLERELEGR